MEIANLQSFYKDMGVLENNSANAILPNNKHIGHFNVFSISKMLKKVKETKTMPYNRRSYYKISLINGHNRAEYADKTIDIKKHALLFASPKVPYNYIPQDEKQSGYFCIFTHEFLSSSGGISPESFPIFRPGSYPVYQIDTTQVKELTAIFEKMHTELQSDYEFKYDLLRNYLLELIHSGQKLQSYVSSALHNASVRVTGLFIELLERQFPITSPQQQPELRTAKDYAERLSVHVNHLNKVLKENTGRTTTEFINARIVQEAKILLKQTDWNISEIAYSLGFEEIAHFSNFFKKNVGISPLIFRSNN